MLSKYFHAKFFGKSFVNNVQNCLRKKFSKDYYENKIMYLNYYFKLQVCLSICASFCPWVLGAQSDPEQDGCEKLANAE